MSLWINNEVPCLSAKSNHPVPPVRFTLNRNTWVFLIITKGGIARKKWLFCLTSFCIITSRRHSWSAIMRAIIITAVRFPLMTASLNWSPLLMTSNESTFLALHQDGLIHSSFVSGEPNCLKIQFQV